MNVRAFGHVLAPADSPLAGLPFALVALIPLLVTDGQHAVLGVVTAVLATFTLMLPLLAIVSGSAEQASEAAARLPLTRAGYAVLLASWTAADLAGALLAR